MQARLLLKYVRCRSPVTWMELTMEDVNGRIRRLAVAGSGGVDEPLQGLDEFVDGQRTVADAVLQPSQVVRGQGARVHHLEQSSYFVHFVTRRPEDFVGRLGMFRLQAIEEIIHSTEVMRVGRC